MQTKFVNIALSWFNFNDQRDFRSSLGNAVELWLSHGKVVLAGQGPEAGRLDWLMADGREMKGSDSRPRPASACPHPALIHPSALILQARLPPPLSRLPVHCLGKQRRFKWRQSDQARGQPPLQHHAPCLLVNCSENWICLLALNCLEETLCKGQNWMDRFLCFITWIINYKLSTSLYPVIGKHLTFPTYFKTLIGK